MTCSCGLHTWRGDWQDAGSGVSLQGSEVVCRTTIHWVVWEQPNFVVNVVLGNLIVFSSGFLEESFLFSPSFLLLDTEIFLLVRLRSNCYPDILCSWNTKFSNWSISWCGRVFPIWLQLMSLLLLIKQLCCAKSVQFFLPEWPLFTSASGSSIDAIFLVIISETDEKI